MSDVVEPIVVESQGGLGNQLFILAYAREIQHRMQVSVILDPWRHSLTPQRPFDLAWLLLPSQYEESRTLADLDAWSRFKRRGLASRFGKYLRRSVRHESTLHFDPELLQVSPGTRVVGYLQSWRYFSMTQESLREKLQGYFCSQRYTSALSTTTPSVAIHLRRGDFMNRRYRRAHPLLPDEYFAAALERFHDILGDFLPIVYSDQPSVAVPLIRGLKFGERAIPAEESSSGAHLLYLISSHSGLVMSNSTLSWWAAWLMAFNAEKVVVPRKWSANPTFRFDDLIPPGMARDLAI